MPRATEVLVEPYREEKFIGGYGWTLVIHRVTAVGITYRAKIISPEGVAFQCPTHFRRHKNCYAWARKQVFLQRRANTSCQDG
jgi:hypothetical protein